MFNKNILLVLAFVSLSSLKLKAQQTNDNDSTIMYVNGEGLQISVGKTSKTKFSLLSTIQSGFAMASFDSANINSKTNRLSLNLVRLSFSATGLKDKIALGLVTDFTSTSPILEAWASLSVFNNKGKLYLGQRQTHTNNRLAMADERYWQVMGQTQAGKSNDGVTFGGLMQNFVGSTREGGVYVETNFKIKKWVIQPSVSVTTGEGQNFFSTQNNVGFKYGGRLDILPMGNFIKQNAFIAQDIYREQKPKLAIGVAASYNTKVSSPIGSENGVITGIFNKAGQADFADYQKIVADLIYKYKGFAFVAEYVNATIVGKELYRNIAATQKLNSEAASAFYNIGSSINLQTSYIAKNGWGVDGRFTSVTPEFSITNSLVRQQNWYTVGVCKFIKNNAVKFGLNTTIVDENTTILSTKRWMTNLAVQILL